MKQIKKDLKGNITEDRLKQLKKEISESLSRDRHRLLVEQPFIGNVAMRFDLIPVRDRRCLTACTDAKAIYMSCDFYLDLSQEERIFVLAHEIWHSLNLTFARRQTRDAELWNIASDMEINNILATSGGSTLVPPKNLMFPPAKMKGQSAETLYDWLLKQQEKNNLNNALSNMDQPDNNDDEGDGQFGRSGQQQKQKSKSKSKSGSGSGDKDTQEKPDTSKDGKNTGKLEGQFDKHTYDGEPDDECEDNNGKKGKDGGKPQGPSDRWGEMGYDDDFRPSIPRDAAERMREAAISAAQSYQREHGDLPAGVEGLINKLAKPEISWREYLSQFVSQCYGGKRQWLPPNRRHVYNDMYFQSRRNERIRGVVAIDTSGSCTGDLPKFFGELKGLIDSFGSYELTVIQADAAVDHVETYEDDNNPLELEEASDIQTFGGGGTDYGPVFKYVEENTLNPDFLIYIGDGYAAMSYDKQPAYPVMWLITKDGTFDFCDWGKKIRFKESSWE